MSEGPPIDELLPVRNVFSLCNRPPWALAAQTFQDSPCPLHIGQVRDSNHRLFHLLDAQDDPIRRGEIFHEYLSVLFSLHHWNDGLGDHARRILRNSYVRFLRGWQTDSNSMEGAVLKGWVHSRMGLCPTFHHVPLATDPQATAVYAIDRLKGCSRTNAIDSQLDLLYEFCQYELSRRFPGEQWHTLYRGTYDAATYRLVADDDPKAPVVCMNNMSSFTSDRECAWEFGSTVWEVRIPCSKIFCFSGLLPDSLLHGENEYLVIGGEYRVHRLLH